LEDKHDYDITLLRQQHEVEITRLEGKVDNLKEELDKKSTEVINKIDVVDESINNKLEQIDVAFRGNSRVGVFEQMRNIRRSVNILFVLIIALAGFKVFGSTLSEWWKEMTGDLKPHANLVQPVVKNSNTK